MTKDYYKILGIAEFESADNIKQAYRKLARKWHPDVAGNSPEVMLKFKEINEAYEILSNKLKKEEYDRARKFYNYANSNQEPKKENTHSTTNPQTKQKNFNFSWDDFIGKKHRETAFKKESFTPQKGDDIESDIDITILEAINGVSKTINMLQTQICPKCNGKKFVNGSKCQICGGKGEHSIYRKFTVKIPAGIKNGSKIRLAGEGNKGINGGRNGDLYLTIHIQEVKEYKTEGLNIFKTIPITPSEAVLGANIKLNTLNGIVNLKLAKNTQNGQKIRLSKCGIVQNEKIGDMIITVEIRIPKDLSEEEINLYKKLNEISSSNIRELQ